MLRKARRIFGQSDSGRGPIREKKRRNRVQQNLTVAAASSPLKHLQGVRNLFRWDSPVEGVGCSSVRVVAGRDTK